jgi:hypothetical protein
MHYGSAPLVVYNELQDTSVRFEGPLQSDAALIAKTLGIGFFHYSPRLWMLGHIEPLEQLQDIATRDSVIDRILSTYPETALHPGDLLYRVRKNPGVPKNPKEYDAPPEHIAGSGRLDSVNFPVMYASQDLEVCIHECRVAAADDIYLGTLSATKELRILDLAEILEDEEGSEFESLDLAVAMLFLAGDHSYPISRAIAAAARAKGFDGIIYPSYFSLLRTGSVPFETMWGISYRRLAKMRSYENEKVIENVALFGRPIEKGDMVVRCINRLLLRRVQYDVRFGPVVVPTEPGTVE